MDNSEDPSNAPANGGDENERMNSIASTSSRVNSVHQMGGSKGNIFFLFFFFPLLLYVYNNKVFSSFFLKLVNLYIASWLILNKFYLNYKFK